MEWDGLFFKYKYLINVRIWLYFPQCANTALPLKIANCPFQGFQKLEYVNQLLAPC